MSNANIENLLNALEGVKQTGAGKWMARCPAHEDRSPSLSIKDLADGRILIKCHAECDTESVLSAMGLQFSDLFPERLPDANYRKTAIGLSPREALDVIQHELAVASLILADVVDCKAVDEPTWARFCKASRRIMTVRDHGR